MVLELTGFRVIKINSNYRSMCIISLTSNWVSVSPAQSTYNNNVVTESRILSEELLTLVIMQKSRMNSVCLTDSRLIL